MTKMLVGLGAIALLALSAVAWYLTPAMLAPEGIDVGIDIGEVAPIDIAMRNSSGKTTNLADIAGPNGTVLIMVRSADWCPFCAGQLKEHAAIADDLADRGYTLASLSYDEPEILATFAADHNIPYAMLSDTQTRFVEAVRLRDPQYPEGHMAYGVPYASVLVLAPNGTVQAKLVSGDYRQRPDNEFVLSMVEDL